MSRPRSLDAAGRQRRCDYIPASSAAPRVAETPAEAGADLSLTARHTAGFLAIGAFEYASGLRPGSLKMNVTL
ncbi:MAG: hypothetical protein FJ313_01410 [Gemmatimonadetes bacterium]|nr:hypothetical protein [Gemmatimonadota bacterium]